MDTSERRRPYHIAYASSDEGGLNTTNALQEKDADTGWMSESNAEQSEIILDLGQLINITRISIRAHPICAARKIQVFGSRSNDYREARYRFLGEIVFTLDIHGDLKLIFLDTRQSFIMFIMSKCIDDEQNPNRHIALEFIEICGRPREDIVDDRSGSAQGDLPPPLKNDQPPPRSVSAISTVSTRRDRSELRSASTNYCGICGRRATDGDAYCRGCGDRL